MASGPGKYDDLCSYVLEQAEADAAIVIVIRGNKGSGFSCQASPELALVLPDILEQVLRDMRAGDG
jgi:hypothetical protein